MTTWTFEKFIYLLRYETDLEIYGLSPEIYMNFKNSKRNDDEIVFQKLEITNDEQAIEQLRVIYELCNERMQIYGSVEEMFEYLKRIDRLEHDTFKFIHSNSNKSHPFTFPKYTDVSGNIICVSNSDVIKYMKTTLMDKLEEFWNFLDINENCKYSFKKYICFISVLQREIKCHRLITDESWKSVYQILCDLCNIENLAYVEEEAEHREKEDLEKLLGEFKESDFESYIKIFSANIDRLNNPNIKKIYSVVAYFHKAVRPFRKELRFLITRKTEKASPDFKPIIRRFKGANYEFYLAKEVSDAFPEENIDFDNENDRIYISTVDSSTFDGILAKYGVDSVIIVEIPIETNSRNNTYPIVCSKGFHCRPVWEEVEDWLYKKIVIQKHSQSHNIYDSIDDNVFIRKEKPTMYLMKYEILMSRFGNENSECAQISFKKSYTKTEVMEIIKKLVENHCIEDEEIKGIIDKVFEVIPNEFISYKQLHDLYYQIILRNILKLCPRIARLKENQGKYKKNQESDLIHKAVEDYYASKYRKCYDCEARLASLQYELIELKRRETNHLEENRKLKETRKIYEKQRNDLLGVVSGLRNHLDESQNELIDSISSNLNKLSVTPQSSKEIGRILKRDSWEVIDDISDDYETKIPKFSP